MGVTYYEGYGLSETMAATHINPSRSREATVFGYSDLRRRFPRRRSGELRRMPAGEVGEIVTHGPQVFLGYWNKPEDSAQAFIEIDGKRFLRTGDLGESMKTATFSWSTA
jgi:fatty-acyl-CoA synthase